MTIGLLIQRKSRVDQVCIKQAEEEVTAHRPNPGCPPPPHPNSQVILCLATCHGVGGGRKEGEEELPLLVATSY